MEEKDIENKIKEKLSHIKPTYALFENTLNKYVTEEDVYRNNKQKASKLSTYQLINNIMKKNILIGIPVTVIAIVAIILVTKSPNKATPLANNSLTPGQNENIIPNNNAVDVGHSVQNQKEDNSSVNSILASFDNDAKSDALVAGEESNDMTTIMAELENYNNIKTNSYEESI